LSHQLSLVGGRMKIVRGRGRGSREGWLRVGWGIRSQLRSGSDNQTLRAVNMTHHDQRSAGAGADVEARTDERFDRQQRKRQCD